MGKINLLDDLTINKIAAGEVIERPASAIKEMVENSIDAGATNITVEIRNGGISYIKITDNGNGIAKDDLEMAFERHATSKIRSAYDLNTVTSMGFRGEALPSIAAIANIEVNSKTQDQENGYKLVIEGGKVLEKTETACPVGTSIIVRNLFYNTPVRYKFLKKDFTESGYIEDIITRIALVNPYIAIKLVNTGKTVISTSGNGKLNDVIYSIYGKDIAYSTINVNYKYDDITIKGVVGRPDIARSNRSNQMFYVNKRFVKHKILTSATEQAYRDLLDLGKFAFVVLNIEMSPSKVDVNVHPAKLEVRFEEENKIYKAVFHAIEDALERENEINKNSKLSNSNNIIADLYYKKNNSFYDDFTKKEENKIENKTNIESIKEERNEDNIVNTSDVLKELKNLNENVNKFEKPVIQVEPLIEQTPVTAQVETIIEQTQVGAPVETTTINNDTNRLENKISNEYTMPEEKELPDGNTYTYEGENKYKIESLLRQLHPENNRIDYYTSQASVSEKKVNYEFYKSENITNTPTVEENKIKGISEKFDLIRQNLGKLNALEQTSEKTENSINNVVKSQENEQIEQTVAFKENANQEEQSTNNENNNEQEESPIIIQNDFEEEQPKIIIQNDEENKEGSLEETKKVPVTEIQEALKQEEVKEHEIKFTPKDFETVQAYSNIENKIGETPENQSSFDKMYEKLFGTKVIKNVEQPKNEKVEQEVDATDIVTENVSLFEGMETYNKPNYKYIGTVFGSYVIVEIEKEMYIINHRLAMEKIVYQNFKNEYYNGKIVDSQMLLLPDIIDVNERELGIVRENAEMFRRAGFIFEDFGDNTIKLSGVPAICMQLNTRELFYQIIASINTVARTDEQAKVSKFIEVIAERIVQKENYENTEEEINNLMEELLKQEKPFEYLYNKQVALKMTKYDIERKFSRK